MATHRIVVSDTGPLISLEKLPDCAALAHRLFDQILVPQSVLDELTEGFETPADYLSSKGLLGIVQVRTVTHRIEASRLGRLHAGEIDAISLAIELNLPLMIEEQEGRRVADALGVRFSGLARELVVAAHEARLDRADAADLLKALLKARRINEAVYGLLLEQLR